MPRTKRERRVALPPLPEDAFDASAEEDGCTQCGHPDTRVVICPHCRHSYIGGDHFAPAFGGKKKCPRTERIAFHEARRCLASS